MVTSYRGNGFIRSSGHQYAVCHDCGRLIEILPGVVPKPEGYPIVSEGRVTYRCAACRDNLPTASAGVVDAKRGYSARHEVSA